VRIHTGAAKVLNSLDLLHEITVNFTTFFSDFTPSAVPSTSISGSGLHLKCWPADERAAIAD
jgi:hypothetical protein